MARGPRARRLPPTLGRGFKLPKCHLLQFLRLVKISARNIMEPFLQDIQAALDSLLAQTCKRTELELEFKDDFDEFGSPGDKADNPEKKRRHKEWFLLERSSDQLGGVPLEAFHQDAVSGGGMLADNDDEVSSAACYAAMRASRSGVYVVTEVEPAEGILIEDLLGRGRYEIPDPLLASEVATQLGDLIVGRLYPHDYATEGEKTTWSLSPAALSIRNPKLLVALKRDIEAMRARSRGPLRMSQHDLEFMFFSEQIRRTESTVADPDTELPSAAELEMKLREQLSASGITVEDVDEFVRVLRRTPVPEEAITAGGNDPVGWIMDELAFETDIDLVETQKAMTVLWNALDREAKARDNRTGSHTGLDEETPDAESIRLRKDALAKFDADRDKGKDIELLFKELEATLDVLDDDETEEPTKVPDFPGVLGALCQEFLWDGARLADQEVEVFSKQHKCLELFIQYGSFIGLAEELSANHIALFLSRWLWEAPRDSGGEYNFDELGSSLEAFCKWLDKDHGLGGLWDEAGDLVSASSQDLGRLQRLNQALQASVVDQATESWQLMEYVGEPDAKTGELHRWTLRSGLTLEAKPPGALAGEALASGDLLLAQLQGDELVATRVYPVSASPHLKATS
ncbi:MAG: hypothetical protein ACI84E_001597 [Planctomycetota bacterium]|jgi:hypothetical protein